MKYAIVIPDGAADRPIDELEDRTPLQAARTPHMDWLATHGKCGTVRNVPKGLPAGSDVAILSAVGYDPAECYTGRAPLEAAARDIEVSRKEWIFRCNLVTVVDGIMEDHSAGNISTTEGQAIVAELQRLLGGAHLKFHAGVAYRHLMIYDQPCDVQTTPPHDILGQAIEKYLPTGKGSEFLRNLIDRSRTILGGHEINAVRRDLGENPATHIWLWGQGKMPDLPKFADRYHTSAAAITAVDLIRGIAKLIGWDLIHVPGATGFVETDYAGKGSAAVAALDDVDLVFVHVEAPDEAGHNADVHGKVYALEQIDHHIVGPLLERLKAEDDQWRLLVMPDHPTPIELLTHTAEPVPFAIAGKDIVSVVKGPFCEETARSADLHIERGHEMMEYLLTVR